MAAGISPIPERRVFRIFISYASEDLAIATAAASCFKTALPDFFAEVNIDKDFLEPGTAFQAQIKAKLQATDVLVILYTGTEKRSHSYTGWEIGFFDHIMLTEPGMRKKISLYLFGPPETTSSEQGIPLGLSKEQLQLSPQQFSSEVLVSPEEPLCKVIEDWQQVIADNMESLHFPRPHYKPEQQAEKCVQNLKLAIFEYLKTTVESVVKPQKQVTIKVKGSALELSNGSLPVESELHPFGALGSGASMDIFGLSDEHITWGKFLDSISSQPFADSWSDAITSVVLSSFPDRVNVDNSQVIVTSDGKKSYRVILTTATKFYDDYREYNLYFVEVLQRDSPGDQDTTYLLKGLELICRFRFAFLEPSSDFLGENIRLMDTDQLPNCAMKLLKELNLLHRDAQEAGLDRPGMWAKWVTIDHLRTITEAYRPCEAKLREIVPKIMAAKGQTMLLQPFRKEMAEELTAMEKIVRPENAHLLREMAAQINKVVEQQDNP
jgi:hypothetical protein